MPRIAFDELAATLARVLLGFGFSPARAQASANLFAQASRDGVSSHGVNRFPRFIETIRNGTVDVHAEPALVAAAGVLERWDGRRGPGNLNACASMDRAMALSRAHGIGCIALANTNHWMRGGSYGWQAADAGVIGICWTNTLANMPPWGGTQPRLGNNPLVMAIPRRRGHLVLDMAMSQFSYGALASYRARNELLPVPGGFDPEGNLTRDPGQIEASQRSLPIGYWKGAGLSLALDMIAAMLSAGNPTCRIPTDPLRETGLSQIFIAFNVAAFGGEQELDRMADDVLAALRAGEPEGSVRYPGEQTARIRAENLRLGVPVDSQIWEAVQALAP